MSDIDATLCEAIWDNAPDAMLLVDDGGRIARVNRTALTLFGYTHEELMGQSIEILVPRRAREGHVVMRSGYEQQPHVRPMSLPMSSLSAQSKSGEEIPVEVGLSPLQYEGRRFTIAIVRDVRIRKGLEDKLRWASSHDALTGLFNRAYFEEELERLAKGRRFPVALIVIDIDGLKPVNDGQGHAAGQLLVAAAKLFSSVARGDDVVARMGGDEFVVVLPQTSLEVADRVLQRMHKAAADHNDSGSGPLIHFSAGVGVAPEPELIAQTMRAADDRLYVVKREKRDPAQ